MLEYNKKIKEYDLFVDYYDEVVRPYDNQLEEELFFLLDIFDEYNPEAKKLLECACWTGLILKWLSKKYKIKWLDLSDKMLNKAKKILPEEVLIQGDMTDFDLEEKFDIVLCNYNSICHLTDFSDWKKFFKQAYNHLNKDWILVFDINTLFEFNNLAESYMYSREVWENSDILCMEVKKTDYKNNKEINNHFYWDLRLFLNQWEDNYKLIRERVSENTFEIYKIKDALNKLFQIEEIIDFHNIELRPDSSRVYFVAKKKIDL